MKILITGATGLIGQEIVKQCLDSNIHVNYLTTSRTNLDKDNSLSGFYWNPDTQEIDLNAFNGVTTIINLAGAPIAKRWNSSYKKKILQSRKNSIKLLYNSVIENQFKIDHFISASAIGYYPNSLTNYYEEDYITENNGFVTEVVEQWESAIDLFKTLNIPVTKVRIGIVLSEKGGALEQISKPIKLFLGSVLGSGEQWQSWIHIEDIAALFLHILRNRLNGVYNGVAPNPVSQNVLTNEIALALNKPIVLPRTPEFVLRMMLGEMSALVIEGQRVSSKKIEQTGFQFKYHHLRSALEDLLK